MTHTQPADLMMQSVLMGWDRGFAEDRSHFDELDALSPGLGKIVYELGRTEMIAAVDAAIPLFREELSGIFAANASETELRSLIDFYSSPTGKKMIRLMTLADASSGKEAAEDEVFTTDEVTKANRDAVRASLTQFTPQDRVALLKFGISPAARAAKVAGPKVQAATAGWMNRVMADFKARLDPKVEALVSKRIKDAG